MNSKPIAQITLALVPLILFGCKSAQNPNGAAHSVYVPGVGYRPATTNLYAPPTIHYWAPSGNAAINAALMNRIR